MKLVPGQCRCGSYLELMYVYGAFRCWVCPARRWYNFWRHVKVTQ